jgi:hypothetical protein
VNLERLGRAARAELTRNPKKSAVLAVICLVAIYFWAPLIKKWTSGSDIAAAPDVAVVATLVPVVDNTATSAAQADSVTKRSWQTLVRLIEQDPNMMTATLEPELRDPFVQAQPAASTMAETAGAMGSDAAPVAPPAPALELTPRQLGLLLNGTIVGPRVRLATINGKTYREQELVYVAVASAGSADGDASASEATDRLLNHQTDPQESDRNNRIEFKLAEIQPQRVVLLREGKVYSLELARTKLPGSDEVLVKKQGTAEY